MGGPQDPLWFSDFLESVTGFAYSYAVPKRIQSKSAKGKAKRVKIWGKLDTSFHSPLLEESHSMKLILPTMSCDDICERLPTEEVH